MQFDANMLKQIQEKSIALQQKIAEMRVEGSAGSDDLKVTVVVNGKHEAVSVEVSPALLQQPIEVLQELMASAITDAAHKMEDVMRHELVNTFE